MRLPLCISPLPLSQLMHTLRCPLPIHYHDMKVRERKTPKKKARVADDSDDDRGDSDEEDEHMPTAPKH